MKRIFLPAGGAILATGLLAAGLAGTAQADDTIENADLAKTQAQAAEVVRFWTRSNNAALRGAKAFSPDVLDVPKIVSKGGYNADTKPGQTEPIGGEKKSTATAQNVNLPKTIGKVFFKGRDGKLYWCSGTSIQSKYRNLVATAGHCVYDIAHNRETVSKWVFVPGYYQGKTPWGIYVGKQAFTHYDFEVYEDYDRDFAFVTVYNAIKIKGTGPEIKQVDKAEYDAYQGRKKRKVEEITQAQYDAGFAQYGPEGPYGFETTAGGVSNVGHDYQERPGGEKKVLIGREVTEYDYNRAPNSTQTSVNGEKCLVCAIDPTDATKVGVSNVRASITEDEYKELVAAKAAGKFLGKVEKTADGNFFVTQYWLKQWVKVDPAKTTWFKVVGYYILVRPTVSLSDGGRLGDNVGGQGVAWNQPTGKYVRTFGYPQGEHPDGNKPFTGVTPKWCYGKTGNKTYGAAKYKVDIHITLKCTVTGGYAGAPWLYKYSNAKRLGYVNGVTSLIVDSDDNKRYDTITSSYFDGETKSVYDAASNSWSGKLVK